MAHSLPLTDEPVVGAVPAFGVDLGLPARAVESAIDHVLAVTADLGDEVSGGALPFDQRRRRDLVRVLARGRHALS